MEGWWGLLRGGLFSSHRVYIDAQSLMCEAPQESVRYKSPGTLQNFITLIVIVIVGSYFVPVFASQILLQAFLGKSPA